MTKLLLTIGIPTYNRPDHLNERLLDLEKLGYFNHPEVQIIIHDNDSDNKDHCLKIKNLQNTFANLILIQSSPNIGFVRGVEKILLAAKGAWITLLGDDDPIVLHCSHFLSLIEKNKRNDHLYFRTMEYENGQAGKVSWFPKLKAGNYSPSELCAKTGFTTHFAHLAAHSFRNKKNLPKLWRKAHQKSAFYGHCIMFIENYKSSFFSGKTVAAWRSGNERISSQSVILMIMELRNLFKYPPTKAIRKFMRLNPRDVRKEGTFHLMNCIKHPRLEFIERYEHLPKNERITLQDVRPQQFNPENDVCIFPTRKSKTRNLSCVFYQKNSKRNKKAFNNAAVVYMCGPFATLESICNIVRKMELTGTILLNDKAVSPLMLLAEYCNARIRKKIWKMQAYAVVLFSAVMYGVEEFNIARVIFNYFKRPQKNLYGIIRSLERTCRIALKKMFLSLNKETRKHIRLWRGIFCCS
jgi:hypothetical protein